MVEIHLRFSCDDMGAAKKQNTSNSNAAERNDAYVYRKKRPEMHRALKRKKHFNRRDCAGNRNFRLLGIINPSGCRKRQKGDAEHFVCYRNDFL